MARHGSLAEQLAALMAYRNRPEGPHEPLGSNWATTPANSNDEDVLAFSQERDIRMTPSVDEIMRQVATGDIERNAEGQTIRIGRLRFSDGTQTEKDFKRGADRSVIEYDRVMPVGAMLGCREKAETALGGRGYGGDYLRRSNEYFAESFDVDVPTRTKRNKRRNGRGFSRDEAQAMLDEAIANTTNMPPVKRYPAGLPAVAERVAENFNGMQTAVGGGSEVPAPWQDMVGAIVQREIWDAAMAEMKAEDVATLDVAMEAGTYTEVGIAAGQSPSYADKKSGGRKRLQAANDNLSAALRKYSA
ncbi:hypothetical protein [Bosea sp. AS-1]|uniref:hypothetical protein n=1 Tax=Bosea sp. AS-1 TaxID=2015316 RepID=UPI0012FD837C|nr:hypothetical protein [Bosea sp. AS-1]